MEQKTKMGGLLALFVTVVVALVLVQSLGNELWEATDSLHNVVNESLTFADNVTETAITDDEGRPIAGGVEMFNQSGTVVPTSEYTYSANGTLALTDPDSALVTLSGDDDADINFSYNWRQLDYVDDSTSRTLIDLIMIFFVIGIFAGGVLYYVWPMLKDIWESH